MVITEVDLLIRHAHVLCLDDADTRVADGAIAVSGGSISHVGTDGEIARMVRPGRTIDAAGAPVHPGLVDGHVHASFHLLRSVHPDATDEDEIVSAFYVPFLDTVTDAEEHAASLLACIEMVRNGTTCFIEAGTVLDPAAVAEAAERVGVRALIGDAFIWDQPDMLAQGSGRVGAGTSARGMHLARAPHRLDEALERLGDMVTRYRDRDGLVRGHICLNGLGSASESLMREARARADAAGVVLTMHHGYSAADAAVDRERFGPHPLVHLEEVGVLGPNVTLSHVNHVTDLEADVLERNGVSVVWAPAASMLWGHGLASTSRHAMLWRRGVNVALGSDSANWSNDLDVFRQADLAVMVTRDRTGTRTSIGADDVLRMATRGGARAAGLDDRIGSIEVGKRADLVIHAADRPEMAPGLEPVRDIIHAGRSKTVRTVIIDGRVVLDDGRFPHLDEAAILDSARRSARALLARLPRPSGQGHSAVTRPVGRS